MDGESCETCRFVGKKRTYFIGAVRSEMRHCCVRAPNPNFPLVSPDAWCGEYQPTPNNHEGE